MIFHTFDFDAGPQPVKNSSIGILPGKNFVYYSTKSNLNLNVILI